MLTNRTLTAAEALEWGLVTEVVPDAELGRQAPMQLADANGSRRKGIQRRGQDSCCSPRSAAASKTQMELEGRLIAAARRIRRRP